VQKGERVLVIDRDVLFEGVNPPHGFGTEHLDSFLARIRTHAGFELRADVEDDPSKKQIIPYMVVTDGEAVFVLRRLETQTEARLRNLYSIGVGGHINPVDADEADPVEAGLRRELEEELFIDAPHEVTPLGYLNDDSNSVGSVHFGLVFRVLAPRDAVSVAEKEMMQGIFHPLSELRALAPEMETWSQLLVGFLSDRPEALLSKEAS
jgi:predicted NUDIX family phosphoesterase